MSIDFYQKLEEITEKDRRYQADAYEFVMQAIGFTQRKLNREGHISGKELLEGIREFGLKQYGPLTKTVFERWGIKTTDDFGKIVFNMVENGLVRKTETDSQDDFKDVYHFNEALDIFKVKDNRLG
jgi:uncharacterized repeat protein (TIGR04138 family)